MNTLAFFTGLCLAAAPIADGATSDTCCEAQQVAAQEGRPAPLTLGIGGPQVRLLAPAAPAAARDESQRGMIGVYLGEGEGRAVIDGLVPGSPAEKAGLKSGDAILAVDGKPVKGAESLGERIGALHAGDGVTLTVERDGWRKDIELTLAPAMPAPMALGAPSGGMFFELDEEAEEADGDEGAGAFLFEHVESPMTLRLRRADAPEGEAPRALGGAFDLQFETVEECEEGAAAECEAECQDECKAECCKEAEEGECCLQGLAVMGDGAHVLGLHGLSGHGGVLKLGGAGAGQVEGKAKVIIRTGDGEEKVHEFDLSGPGGIGQWIGAGEDGEKEVKILVQGLPHGAPQITTLKPGSAPHVFQWRTNAPVPMHGDPVEIECEVECEAEGEGVREQTFWYTGKADDDDDQPRIRRRVMGMPMAPPTPAPPAVRRPAAGELQDLRRELDELRQELRELRQALRRARAGAGGR